MPRVSEKSVVIKALEYLAVSEEVWPDDEVNYQGNDGGFRGKVIGDVTRRFSSSGHT